MIRLPKVGASKFDDEKTLNCPRCGYENLHHSEVRVFDRYEDENRVLVTTAQCHVHEPNTGRTAETRLVENAASGNPSDRRGGVVITFVCEHCPDKSDLEISQHKGATFIEWRLK